MTKLHALALARHIWPRITACTRLIKAPSAQARWPVAIPDGPSVCPESHLEKANAHPQGWVFIFQIATCAASGINPS